MQNYSAEDRVKLARDLARPTSLDYIEQMTSDFIELHGDRRSGDDMSVVGGIGFIENQAFTIIGQQRGKNFEENLLRNNGMTTPAGYHKAIRLMKQAEQFQRPVLTLVDTKGAYPGKAAEESNQNYAISCSLETMLNLTVPIISIIIGEGGSGGALALSLGNKLAVLKNSIFSVVSPEGAAAILWKDQQRVAEAIEALKLFSADLLALGVIDHILPEIIEGSTINLKRQTEVIKRYVLTQTQLLQRDSGEAIRLARKQKYRKIGQQ